MLEMTKDSIRNVAVSQVPWSISFRPNGFRMFLYYWNFKFRFYYTRLTPIRSDEAHLYLLPSYESALLNSFSKYLQCCTVDNEAKLSEGDQDDSFAMHRHNSGSLFDELPGDIIHDYILPFLGLSCHHCKKLVTLLNHETRGSCQDRDNVAVYLEESVRVSLLVDESTRFREFEDFCFNFDHSGDTMIAAGCDNVHKRGEAGLLGPFRFCLKKNHVQSIEHLMSLGKEIMCSICAENQQREHWKQEIDRIESARKAAVLAWMLPKIERQVKSPGITTSLQVRGERPSDGRSKNSRRREQWRNTKSKNHDYRSTRRGNWHR